MRPDFSYIEKANIENKRKKEQAALKTEEDSKAMVLEEAKPVTMTMRRPESQKAQELKLKSWEHVKGEELKEAWETLHFRDQEDPASYDVLNRIVRDPHRNTEVGIDQEQYLKLINPVSLSKDKELIKHMRSMGDGEKLHWQTTFVKTRTFFTLPYQSA
jgi:hypothetical protein